MRFDLQWFAEKAIENQTANQLRKGIRSLKKKIAPHQNKTENPAKYCDDWDLKDERGQNGLIRHWKKEIIDSEESIRNRIEQLKERGENYE